MLISSGSDKLLPGMFVPRDLRTTQGWWWCTRGEHSKSHPNQEESSENAGWSPTKELGKNETSRGQRQKAQKTPTTKGGAERIRVVYSRGDLEETSAETVEGLFQRRSAGKTLCIRKNLTRSSARQVLIKRKFQTVKVSYELEETAKGNSGNTLPWCFFGTVNKTA